VGDKQVVEDPEFFNKYTSLDGALQPMNEGRNLMELTF
jgi:hypothetical protein